MKSSIRVATFIVLLTLSRGTLGLAAPTKCPTIEGSFVNDKSAKALEINLKPQGCTNVAVNLIERNADGSPSAPGNGLRTTGTFEYVVDGKRHRHERDFSLYKAYYTDTQLVIEDFSDENDKEGYFVTTYEVTADKTALIESTRDRSPGGGSESSARHISKADFLKKLVANWTTLSK